MRDPKPAGSSFFQRYLLPGFAFKAVVIGGGYATGRELAEFFLPSGAWGGLAAMPGRRACSLPASRSLR